MARSRIAELASLIANRTADIDNHLAAKGLPTPSFDADQPTHLLNDSKLATSRRNIIEATDELHALMLGPVGILTSPSVRTVKPRAAQAWNGELIEPRTNSIIS